MKNIKKIIFAIITSLMLFSCYMQDNALFIGNREINSIASKFIDTDENLVFANFKLQNVSTYAEMDKLIIKVRVATDILGGFFGKSESYVMISSDLKVKDNKLYLKNPRVVGTASSISVLGYGVSSTNDIASNAVNSIIINAIQKQPLYDFAKKRLRVKDVQIVNTGIELILED